MTLNWKHLAVAVVVVVLIAIVVAAYTSEREDRIRAEVTVAQRDHAIEQRDKQTAELVAELRRAAEKVKTPEQAVVAMPKVIELPVPIRQVEVPALSKVDATSITSDPLPAAASTSAKPGDLIVPQESAVPLYQHLAKCKQDQALLATCQQDLDDTKVQRDAAIAATKGGSFFTRVKRNAKWFVIGAAAGAAAGAIARR